MNKLWNNLAIKDRLKVGVTALVVAILLLLSIVPIPDKVYIGTNYLIATSESNGIGVVYPFYTPSYRLNYTVYSIEERTRLEDIYYRNVPQIHTRLDRHHTYYVDDAIGSSSGYISNLALLNASYGSPSGIPFDEDLWEYLQLGITLTELTNGSFHMAIGKLSDFWDEVLISPALTDESLDPLNDPDREALLSSLLACLPNPTSMASLITRSDDQSRILFHPYYSESLGRTCTSEEMSITFGALGKGIANDVLQHELLDAQLTNGVIYGGASSMTMMKDKLFFDPWRVAMPYPFGYGSDFTAEAVVTIVNNRGFSISQSGGYEGGYVTYYDETIDDWQQVWRHHIIDPLTGYPLNMHHAVIVYTEVPMKSGYLDALSTALTNLSIADGVELIGALPFNVEAVWIYQTSRTEATVTATSSVAKTLSLGKGVTLEVI